MNRSKAYRVRGIVIFNRYAMWIGILSSMGETVTPLLSMHWIWSGITLVFSYRGQTKNARNKNEGEKSLVGKVLIMQMNNVTQSCNSY